MKTLLLFFCLTGLAFAGPLDASVKAATKAHKIYIAFGPQVGKGSDKDGGTWYVFTCKNAKGDIICVGIEEYYIKSIQLNSKTSITHRFIETAPHFYEDTVVYK